MAAEGKIRKYLKARVEAYGGEVRAVSWLGRRNAPDVLCLFPTRKLVYAPTGGVRWLEPHPFVETKAPGGTPTEAQAREHERMRAAGCVVLVLSTEEQIDAWLPP
jgi:hypothetical protein